MTHLLILCEGVTERRVLKSFLNPYWSVRFQTVEIQSYDGNQELRLNFKADAEKQLSTEPDSCVLCLVDLYEEPFRLYDPQSMTIEEGFDRIRDYMYVQVDARFHSRFGSFPVAMEIETWLLADPNVQQHLGITNPISYPETEKHPFSYLEKIYQGRNQQYGKVNDGITLFRKADAQRVYADNCPHFNQMIDWLVSKPPDAKAETIRTAQAEWERLRDELYNTMLELDAKAMTDEELDTAIQAEAAYHNHLQTYDHIFK